MEKALNRLYKVSTILFLGCIAFIQLSQIMVNTQTRDEVRILNEKVESQSLQIDSLKSKMDVMDVIHPSVKKN